MITLNFNAKYVLKGFGRLILPWLRVFFKEKSGHDYAMKAEDWEGEKGTYIITQMIFSGFLNTPARYVSATEIKFQRCQKMFGF